MMRQFNPLCTHQSVSPTSVSHRSRRWLAMVIASTAFAPALAQQPACDGCKDGLHSHAHHAPIQHSGTNAGVYLPSLQSIFVDKMNRAGDRIEHRLHRHTVRVPATKHAPCDRPDCTQCVGALPVDAKTQAQRTPFANNAAAANSLPRIVQPAARGKLSDVQPNSTENILDARRLVPALSAPTDSPAAIQRQTVPTEPGPSNGAQPAVEPQPSPERKSAADLLDIAKRSEPNADRSQAHRDASAPVSAGSFVKRQPSPNVDSDSFRETATLESIGTRPAEVAPPAKLPSATRAIPESAPAEPRNASTIDAKEETPDILVDPFRDDPRPNPTNEFGQNRGPMPLPPKPLPNPSSFGGVKPNASSSTLRAKFESAKRASGSPRSGSQSDDSSKR
ncbi:MAG: hypothetical protein ACK5OB_14705 [Pirellula sp.]